MKGCHLAAVPFLKGQYLDFGSLNIPILFFVVLGTFNRVNFTDGLDGAIFTIVAAIKCMAALMGLF